jgi:hypothetical protein
MGAVGLVLHPTKPVDRSIETIIASARGMPVRLLARELDRHRVPAEVSVVPDAQFAAELDGLVTLGGDGTMLGGMRLVIDRPVPVLGVNHGNLGFLVEVTPDQLPSALKRLAAGDFCIEQYACLEVDAGAADLAIRFGFNDVVLGRSRRAGAVSLDRHGAPGGSAGRAALGGRLCQAKPGQAQPARSAPAPRPATRADPAGTAPQRLGHGGAAPQARTGPADDAGTETRRPESFRADSTATPPGNHPRRASRH